MPRTSDSFPALSGRLTRVENAAAVPARRSGKTATTQDGAAPRATPAHHGRPWTHLVLAPDVRERRDSGGERAGHAETEIVVAVRGIVPVAVRRAEVVRIVVPGTAALDPTRGGRTGMTRSGPVARTGGEPCRADIV